MRNQQEMVRLFHERFKRPFRFEPLIIPIQEQELRCRLIFEELGELREAFTKNNIIDVADAIGDLLYVVLGTAVQSGIDIEPIFDEIHRSNMTKVWPDGSVHYDKHGKVLKPKSYSKADLEPLLAMQHIDALDGA